MIGARFILTALSIVRRAGKSGVIITGFVPYDMSYGSIGGDVYEKNAGNIDLVPRSGAVDFSYSLTSSKR